MNPRSTTCGSAPAARLVATPVSNGCFRQYAYMRRSCFGPLSAAQCVPIVDSLRGAAYVGRSVIGNTAEPSGSAAGGVARDPVDPGWDGLLDAPEAHVVVAPALMRP